ncbi:MAG: glycosyltransferase family 39 protein [Fimbriimonas ginsengisoli]|uniref:Glycosyltransferase family 39 protein n=1 Tax=Fimbriimonas ginsengisoli TaxID=1005039 RepID=A0A931LVE6_FIMGI|nr:glycosyltransferase family 39 protein [Fimbriimonas ginsengisoli]
MRTAAILATLMALHGLLAIFYAGVTPYRSPGILLGQRDPKTGLPQPVPDVGAPDERQHANYVQHLLDTGTFPVFRPGDPNLIETYQSHQTPAYYILAVGWAKLCGVRDVAAPEGRRLRYLNALLGMGTVAGVFFMGVWGTGRKGLALTAAGFAALLPMLIALDSAITNDSLLYLSVTWTVGVAALCAEHGWTWRRAMLLGALAGLACLSKTSAITVLPVLVVAGLIPARRRWPMLLACIALACLIALPWWLRNARLYGDALGIQVFQQGFTGSPRTADLVAGVGPVDYWLNWFAWWTARSFIGAFGYMDIFVNGTGLPMSTRDPNTLYRLLIAAGIALAAAGLYGLKRTDVKAHWRPHVVCAFFGLLVFAGFLRFNLTYFQAQARYIIPVIGPIALLLALGLLTLAPRKKVLAAATMCAVLLALNVYVLGRLPDEFARRTTPIGSPTVADRPG